MKSFTCSDFLYLYILFYLTTKIAKNPKKNNYQKKCADAFYQVIPVSKTKSTTPSYKIIVFKSFNITLKNVCKIIKSMDLIIYVTLPPGGSHPLLRCGLVIKLGLIYLFMSLYQCIRRSFCVISMCS